MTRIKVFAKIREYLNNNNAPLVEINDIVGFTQKNNGAIVKNLYVSMGECTGDEFEAIKNMRENIEYVNDISIINIIITLKKG